jgi:hypothetical protein
MIHACGGSRRRGTAVRGRGGRAALALAAAASVLGAGRARAETTYDFLPSATFGITDNASAAPNGAAARHGDGFSILSATGRAHKLTLSSDNSLGLRVSDTFYYRGYGPTALMVELAGVSSMTLGASWQLRLAAALTYGQTSSPTRVDINSGLPTVVPSGANPYLSGSASQEGLYSWSPRTRLVEALRWAGVDYLNRENPPAGSMGVPVNFNFIVGGTLRFEHDVVDNLFMVEGNLTDSVVPGRNEVAAHLAEHVFLANLVAGWRRDFGLEWSTELTAGALGIFDDLGTSIIRPAGSATVGYRRLYWYGTLTAFQAAVPNVFVAAATITDSVFARVALPLGLSERYYVLGYGGFTYSQLVQPQGTFRGYDLWTGGASFTARSEKYPFWGSIDYMISSQTGNIGDFPGATIPDLERQSLMLTIGCAFTTGHEQPPIFHGVMGAIRPLTDQTSGPPVGNPASYGAGAPGATAGAPGWSGSPNAAPPPGSSSRSKVVPTLTTPGAPGWSGTPTTTDAPGAPGWSGNGNGQGGVQQESGQGAGSGQGSGNIDNVTR